MPKPIRIVVGLRTGERASVWRIWFGPSDVYVGFRELGGSRKASIHFPRELGSTTLRYVGFTRDFAQKLRNGPVRRQQRSHAEWRGAEIAPDIFVEFRMRVPRSELRQFGHIESQHIHWVSPGPDGTSTEVAVISGPANHDLQINFPSDVTDPRCIAETQLDCGRTVWIIAYNFVGPSSEVRAQLRRAAIQSFAVHGQLPSVRQSVTPDSRLNLTFELEDGSAGEWEFSGDLLGGA